MRVEQVMFRSGPVRCVGDIYLPDGADGIRRAAGVVMGHSVVMVKEALAPHADYLVRAGFVVLAIDWRTVGGSEAQAEELFPSFTNQMTVESLEHVLLWAPVQFIHRLAPTPLLLVTGVDNQVHAIDEVLRAYDRAWQPKRLELLPVDEFGLSIEPGLGQSMRLAAGFFNQHLSRTSRFEPSPTPEQAKAQGLRPEYSRSYHPHRLAPGQAAITG